MQAVLAAIDFSPVADDVVRIAAELAERFGSKLWLVHVAAPDPAFVGYDTGPQPVRDQRAAKLRHEHRELQERADALRARGLDATALLVQGPSAEKIVEEADRHDAAVIVVGSHGRSGLARLVVGSVSEDVLRRARRPVLVVPSPKE